MKTAIVNTKKKTFLATNSRWYSLTRSVRRAPKPLVFHSKREAVFSVLGIHGLLKTEFKLVPPEKIKTTEPRKVAIRTCAGRSSR